ncbi:TonB-dependent receptor [Flavobacterium sp.]|uniref:TonB-dependent receptor n=1 Tax=Flavobacterium sp. TaxID=239 RepID=UPI0011FAB1B4|nr:TonB-dependent receptor [Flavobacterium sp.]RZJ73217.1 MAG: TonB-dependent receptor [Flavobacterium sp.]
MKLNIVLVLILFLPIICFGQGKISGKILSDGLPLPGANVSLLPTSKSASTDENGNFSFSEVVFGDYTLKASFIGLQSVERKISVKDSTEIVVNFALKAENSLEEVVVTGTLKAVTRSESAVPVEIYSSTFFKKNPTANIFEGLQTVNGVRPQFNCNICNTGDIHINGLEGPYTLVLIDGMPIVSGLSTVYGLSGIPNSLVDRIEIVKGPASSLYGSEAVGGLINIITKSPKNTPVFSADVFSTSWGEVNADVGFKLNPSEKFSVLTGINYFNYSNPIDENGDNFTDVTLQDRISIFQKWNLNRESEKLFSVMARYFYEDRWGGDMRWNKSFRGGNEIYGESIYTNRWEFVGAYELPLPEKFLFNFSYTDHDQNSVYGQTQYLAQQRIGFAQLTWDKKIGRHDMLFGAAMRYQYYNDNTTATASADETTIPGIFAQDEIKLAEKHHLLLGARYDYNSRHGSIFTPRLAHRWKISKNSILRLNAGTGFRVVNLFTEEHAALTGSREVIIEGDLKPERSMNVNLNLLQKFPLENGLITAEIATWYTHFSNSILPDYDTNPNAIIYKNLDGNAVTKGISANIDVITGFGLKAMIGATFMDVSRTENGVKERQILTERFSGTWTISYSLPKLFLSIDYSGNLYGPMRLPLAGELDPRPEYSPTWSIQNIQFTFTKIRNFEIYFGVKNLLDWTPAKNSPFLIARSNDPFDQNVQYGPNGNVLATPDNPYGLTFDTGYVYGPNQGLRTFGGIRYTFR